MDPLDSRGLAAFAAAVETGSIHGAADALELTQSGATKRIKALERRLGVQLLVREARGVRPTRQGMALYPEARRGLDALAEAERSVGAERSSAPLRITASHTLGECLLPGWLAAFRAVAPGMRPQLDVTNSPGAILAVREGTAEVGFVEGPEPLDAFDTIDLGEDEIVLAVAQGHRWSDRDSVAPDELRGGRYISRERGSGTRAFADTALAEVGVELEAEQTVASLGGLKRSIADGGFTLLSRLALEPQIGTGELLTVPLEGLRIRRPLAAIRRADGNHRGAGRHFWRWLANERSAVPV